MIDKAKLKRESKELKTPMGVYQIKNLVNGKVFIGSAYNVPGKLNGHQFTLKIGSHINPDLQKEYNQFGAGNFEFGMLDELKYKEDPDYNYKEDLKFLEEAWIEKLQPFGEKGYNRRQETGHRKQDTGKSDSPRRSETPTA
ncbi:MAG: GIY-YIG nuclease family protein [Ignavibacteriaceae bacterium]|nr:GIY-YIG nuclease family protein [Ignavibacteriaceae bacterium]